MAATPAPPAAPQPPAGDAAGVEAPRGLASIIRAAASRHRVPERLVRAIIAVESNFNPRAVSRKGARGLMQLMPATAAMLGVRNAFDPADNVDGGVRHLRSLLDRLGDNVPLALAAYNAGEQAVAQHRGVPPYPETQDYVARIMRLVESGGTSLATSVASTVGEGLRSLEDAAAPGGMYRTVSADGVATYTNIVAPGGR